MSLRVAHLISEYSSHEAMGRTITETAMRTPGIHHLITTRAHDDAGVFASVIELGGSLSRFPAEDPEKLNAALDALQIDVVHLHMGVLGPFLANRAGLDRRRVVYTMYAWPSLPGRAAWRHAGWRGLRSSNVLPNRVLATAVVPAAAVRRSLTRLAPAAVLTPDPRVRERLGAASGIPVEHLPSGAPVDPRRASFRSPDGPPTIVFAGRAESVRGIGTLIDTFPLVRAAVPDARLRLLLLPRPELAELKARVDRLGLGDAVDFHTDPVPDLLGEFAKAQVGAWPFLADYTTSPPAMALAEAMAVGLPVVSTPVACVRSVLQPGVDGLTVPPGDSGALARALVRLLSDRATWQRYADAGVRASARMTWDATAATTERAYESAQAASRLV